MSIDRLETLRSIKEEEGGSYRMHIICPDGRNECFRGVSLLRHREEQALVIQEELKGGKKERILRLVRVTDPEVAQEIDQHALFEKMPPMVAHLASSF